MAVHIEDDLDEKGKAIWNAAVQRCAGLRGTAQTVVGYLNVHENEKREGDYVRVPATLLRRLRDRVETTQVS